MEHQDLDSLSDAELQALIAQLSNPPPTPDVPVEAYHYNVPLPPLPPPPPSTSPMAHTPPPQPSPTSAHSAGAFPPSHPYLTTLYTPDPGSSSNSYSPHHPSQYSPSPPPATSPYLPQPSPMSYSPHPLPPLPAQPGRPLPYPAGAAMHPAQQAQYPQPLPPQPQSQASASPMWNASAAHSPAMYAPTPMAPPKPTAIQHTNGAGLHVQVQEPGAPQPLARPPHLTSPIINGSVAQGAASLTGVHAMNPTSAPQMTPVQHATMAPAPVGYRPMVSPAPAVMSTGAQAMLEKAANARAVDVCFVVDCTGSMSHWIQQVKDKVIAIVKGVKNHPKVKTVRLGFVGYRDYFYPADQRYSVVPFTEDEGQFELVVRGVQALYCKGNDEPEDMLGGLDQALKLDWKGKTRIIILVADAPCHGKEFHNLEESSANANYHDPFKPDTLLRAMGTRFNIDLTFCRISADTDIMISKFKPLYDDKRGSGRGLKVIELTTSVDDFLPKMVQTITESVNKANK